MTEKSNITLAAQVVRNLLAFAQVPVSGQILGRRTGDALTAELFAGVNQTEDFDEALRRLLLVANHINEVLKLPASEQIFVRKNRKASYWTGVLITVGTNGVKGILSYQQGQQVELREIWDEAGQPTSQLQAWGDSSVPGLDFSLTVASPPAVAQGKPPVRDDRSLAARLKDLDAKLRRQP